MSSRLCYVAPCEFGPTWSRIAYAQGSIANLSASCPQPIRISVSPTSEGPQDVTVGTVHLPRSGDPILGRRPSRAALAGLNMSVAAWASHLPEVHPFLLDTARLIDRTVARFERRICALQAELAQGRSAFAARRGFLETTAESLKRTAYQEAIAEYQAMVSECCQQFEAHVASKWSAAEIAQAKSRVGAGAGGPRASPNPSSSHRAAELLAPSTRP